MPPYMIPGGKDVDPLMKKDRDHTADNVGYITCYPLYAHQLRRYQTKHRRKCLSGNSYCICDPYVSQNVMFMRSRIIKGF